MSRNRYDRDDEDNLTYTGGGSRGGGGGWGSDDRYDSERMGYSRGGSTRGRDYGYDESYGARGRGLGGGRDLDRREDYGRGGYGEQADYRYDESRYGGTSGRRGGERYDDRSAYEEGRDYLRRQFGDRGRGRGSERSRLKCRDIMTKDVTVATRDTSLEEVARMMRDEDTGVIPVVERQDATTTTTDTGGEGAGAGGRTDTRTYGNGRLVGLITDRDIVIRAIAEGKDARSTRAEEIMTDDIHTAQPNDRVIDVIRKMGDKQVRRIPVVDSGGNLRGIISMADIALETEEDRELADALEEISSGSSFWSKIFG